MPFFSVIMPLYNKAPYIRRSLESVLQQTFREFEIIVIDDGSTDDGASIVSTYQDRRICLIRQENAGVSAARNRGIFAAKAEWISFLDADDEYFSNYLEKMHGHVLRHLDIGFAFSNVLFKGQSCLRARRMINTNAAHFEVIDDYCDFLCRHSLAGPHTSSIVVRKSLLQEVGCFPAGVTRGEDTVTWLRLGWSSRSGFEPSCLTFYHGEAAGTLPRKNQRPSSPDLLLAAYIEWKEQGKFPVQMEASWRKCMRGYVLGHIIELIRFGDRKEARRLFLKTVKLGSWWKMTAQILILLLLPDNLLNRL
jgi:glycosyltransferase involved in cell wall biosynthesis